MSNEFLDYIDDILDAMQKAEILVEGISVAEFEANFRINFAVMRALEIIGEATKHVPETVRDQYPDIPWKGMAGMRDRIIHGYDDVALTIVWNVVQNDIPRIKPQSLQLLADFSS